MAPIVHSVDISRKPEDVFAYLTDLGRFTEWQEQSSAPAPWTTGR